MNLRNFFGDFEDSAGPSAVGLGRSTTRSTEEAMTQALGESRPNAARRHGDRPVPETSTGQIMRRGLIAIDDGKRSIRAAPLSNHPLCREEGAEMVTGLSALSARHDGRADSNLLLRSVNQLVNGRKLRRSLGGSAPLLGIFQCFGDFWCASGMMW